MEKLVEALKVDAEEWKRMAQLLADYANFCTKRAEVMNVHAENLGKLLKSK